MQNSHKMKTPVFDHCNVCGRELIGDQELAVGACAACMNEDVPEEQPSKDRLEWQDWERWAREVLTDFKIPFDNHKVGMRLAITQWMAEKLNNPK